MDNRILWPSDYEFAVLSNQAYFTEKEQKQPNQWSQSDANLPPLTEWQALGWELYKSAENKAGGYYGYAWVNHAYKHLVFAHRGTAPTFLGSLKADVEGIVLGDLTKQQITAAQFVAEVLGAKLPLEGKPSYKPTGLEHSVSTEFSDYHLAFTGHSLGAWLAELCTATFHKLHAYAVTFDGPGAGPMLKKLSETNIEGSPDFRLSQLNITTYLTAPNLINTCHPHVGQVYRIYPNGSQDSVRFFGLTHIEDQLTGLKNWFTHTITQHGTRGILATFKDHASQQKKRVTRWPRLEWEQLSNVTGSLFLSWDAILTVGKALYYGREFFSEYRCFHEYVEGTDLIEPSESSLSLEQQYKLIYHGHYRATPELQRTRISHQHPAIKGLWLLGVDLPDLPEPLNVLLKKGTLSNDHLDTPMDSEWTLIDPSDIRQFLRELSSTLAKYSDVQTKLGTAATTQPQQGTRLLGLEYQLVKVHTTLQAHSGRLDALEAEVQTYTTIPLTPAQKEAREEEIARQLKDFQTNLDADHQRHVEIPTIFNHTVPLTEQSFINLAIIEEQVQKIQEKLSREVRDEDRSVGESSASGQRTIREQHLASFETIYAAKKPIELQKLWETKIQILGRTTDYNASSVRFLMALGRAGVGKSTCCKYIALMHKQLWPGRFDFVFLIPWRALTKDLGFHAGMSLSEVLYHHWAKGKNIDHNDWKELYKKIAAQPDKVLLLLDGYDELTPQQLGITTSLEEALIVKGLLDAPFYRLLTSRPYGVQNLLHVQVRLEIIGFTDDNTQTYVNTYFNNVTIAQEAYKFMRDNPSIWGVAHIPVTLELLCETYLENKDQLNEDFTLTRLYHTIVTSLLRRYLSNRQRGDKALQEVANIADLTVTRIWALSEPMLRFLSELAQTGLAEGNLIIGPHLIDHYRQGKPDTILHDALASGLLKSTESSKTAAKQPVYFIHLTFQEFLTAYALIGPLMSKEKATQSSAEKALKAIQYAPRYQVVMWFCAGLWDLPEEISPWPSLSPMPKEPKEKTEEKPKEKTDINRFWQVLLQPPRDISLIYDASLLVRCIEEAAQHRKHKPLPAQYREAIAFITRLLKGFSEKAWLLPDGFIRALSLCPHFMADHGLAVQLEIYEANQKPRSPIFFISYHTYCEAENERKYICGNLLTTWSQLGTGLQSCSNGWFMVLISAAKNPESEVNTYALEALGKVFTYLNLTQQDTALEILMLGTKNSSTGAAKALGDIFPNLRLTQQDTALKALITASRVSEDAIDALTKALPHLNPTQQKDAGQAFMIAVMDSYEGTEPYSSRRRSAFVYLNPNQKKQTAQAIVAVAVKTSYRCAVEAVGDMFPYLNPNQQNIVFQDLMTNTRDANHDVLKYIGQALRKVFPHLKQAQQNTALEILMVDTKASRNYALEALANIFPNLSQTQQEQTAQTLITVFTDLFKYVEENTIETLAQTLPHLNTNQQETAFQSLMSSAKSSAKRNLRSKAVYALGCASPHLNQIQREQAAQLFIEYLKSIFEECDEYAALALGRALPYLNPAQQKQACQTLAQASKNFFRDEDVRYAATWALKTLPLDRWVAYHFQINFSTEILKKMYVPAVWNAQIALVIDTGQLHIYQPQNLTAEQQQVPTGLTELLQGRIRALEAAFKEEAGI